jgi:hypothetical protein
MMRFSKGVSAEQVRAAMLDWIGMLAAGRFAEAVDFLSPEIPEGSASTNEMRWTPGLLESVIANYGHEQPVEEDPRRLRVAPLTKDLLPLFDKELDIDFEMWESTAADGSRFAGAIHARMPIAYENGPAISDMTARFRFKHFPDGQMALVLLDIHVM